MAQQLVLPSHSEWTQLQEGKTLSFVLSVRDPDQSARFSLEGGNGYEMQLDSLGNYVDPLL